MILGRSYAGEATRERIRTLGPVAPWHTTITVDAVHLDRGRHTLHPRDHVFEIAAEWTGPPPTGFPPSPEPVAARDVYALLDGDLELALAIAEKAREEFARGGDEPPDLRALANELRNRG